MPETNIDKIKKGNKRIKTLNLETFEGMMGTGNTSADIMYNFLTYARDILVNGYLNDDDIKKLYDTFDKKNSGKSKQYKNIMDKIYPDLNGVLDQYNTNKISQDMNEEDILYELAKIAFFANKITKMIVYPALEEMKLNYRLTDEEFNKLENYYQKIYFGDYKEASNEERKLYNEEDRLISCFEEYKAIMQANDVCYYIKDLAIRTMLNTILIRDNRTLYKEWGTYYDNKENLVFIIGFPGEEDGFFQFHLEGQGESVFSIEDDKNFEFIQKDDVKNNKKNIVYRNRQHLTDEDAEIIRNAIKTLRIGVEKSRASIANGLNLYDQPSIVITQGNRDVSIAKKDAINKIKQRLIETKVDGKVIIAVQQGRNLDINACICAIYNWLLNERVIHSKEELKIERVGAGNPIPNVVNIDTGELKGIRVGDETIRINSDEKRSGRSACSTLASLGIYVPKAIIKGADKIYSKEEILEPKCGLILARELDWEKLFEFAETERDGVSLIETNLSLEEIEKWGLIEKYEERVKQLKESIELIKSHTYEINEKKWIIVPQTVPYGSYIAYSYGADYYCSIDKHYSGKGCTFAITANKDKNEGILSDKTLEFGRALRRQHGAGVFVNANNSMIICGGQKNREFSIYNGEDAEKAVIRLFDEIISNELGISVHQSLVEELHRESEFVSIELKDIMTRIIQQNLVDRREVYDG